MMITVFGMGYVGLTLALFLTKKNIQVVGYDISKDRIFSLLKKKSYVLENGINDILNFSIDHKLLFPKILNEDKLIAESELAFVTIGTSLHDGSIKLSEDRLIELCLKVDKAKFDVIVLRSTVAVGTCKKISSMLKNTNIVFAPERTVEGVAMEELQSLPQIIGSPISKSRTKVEKFFTSLGVGVVLSDSWEEAELAKLSCNTYRDYNFSFANSIIDIADSLGIDGNKVLKVSSQDYKRMPDILPGPVSGPCLTKDTHILEQSLTVKSSGMDLLSLSRFSNDLVCKKIVIQLCNLAISKKVSFWGTSFKSNPDTSDTRESHTLDIIAQLQSLDFDIEVFDPHIDNEGAKSLGHMIVSKPSLEMDRVVIFGSWSKWIKVFVDTELSNDSFSGIKKFWCYPIEDSYKFKNSFRFGQKLT